jgi:hypothetical protein
MLYRPLSLVASVLGGILAGAVFTKVWAVVVGEEALEGYLAGVQHLRGVPVP